MQFIPATYVCTRIYIMLQIKVLRHLVRGQLNLKLLISSSRAPHTWKSILLYLFWRLQSRTLNEPVQHLIYITPKCLFQS